MKKRNKIISHETLDSFFESIKRDGASFEEDHKIAIYYRYWLCFGTNSNLHYVAREMKKKITEKFPLLKFTYIVVTSYRDFRGCCCKKRRLGYLVIRKKLGAFDARIAYLGP